MKLEIGVLFWGGGELIYGRSYCVCVADREILISGTCDECFDKLFPPEED